MKTKITSPPLRRALVNPAGKVAVIYLAFVIDSLKILITGLLVSWSRTKVPAWSKLLSQLSGNNERPCTWNRIKCQIAGDRICFDKKNNKQRIRTRS